MTVSEYAEHRGVSQPTVSRAIQNRRLRDSVVQQPNGRPLIVDVELADREWAANTDATKSRSSDPAELDEDLIAATTRWKIAQADAVELKLRKDRGELVRALDVERAIAEAFLAARTSLLALPSQIKQDLPHLTLEEVARIDARVREALEALSARSAPQS
jgi:phage terminase Nu1 subunit (DNA packaging protein)